MEEDLPRCEAAEGFEGDNAILTWEPVKTLQDLGYMTAGRGSCLEMMQVAEFWTSSALWMVNQ